MRQELGNLTTTQPNGSPLRIAVAFWGDGSEALFNRAGLTCQLICNLDSGGTNPDVIRRLRAKDGFDVRHNPRLHAKVYLGHSGAVVSSANASSSGLGLDPRADSGWIEAGIFLPSSSPQMQEIQAWFTEIWHSSNGVEEKDLLRAEANWIVGSQETVAKEQPTVADGLTDLEASRCTTVEMFDVRTVHVRGRIKPQLRDLRSAAAVVALGGENGAPMPYSAFVFLFSGGETSRAFDYHDDHGMFLVEGSTVKLKPQAVGYFVGTDRSLASCTDKKRRKSADDDTLAEAAAWMLGAEKRPAQLEGEVKAARFSRTI